MLHVEIGIVAGLVTDRYNDVLHIGYLVTPKVLLNPLLPFILVTISLDLLFFFCIFFCCMHKAGDHFVHFSAACVICIGSG